MITTQLYWFGNRSDGHYGEHGAKHTQLWSQMTHSLRNANFEASSWGTTEILLEQPIRDNLGIFQPALQIQEVLG